jgi:hypothetical protein
MKVPQQVKAMHIICKDLNTSSRMLGRTGIAAPRPAVVADSSIVNPAAVHRKRIAYS